MHFTFENTKIFPSAIVIDYQHQILLDLKQKDIPLNEIKKFLALYVDTISVLTPEQVSEALLILWECFQKYQEKELIDEINLYSYNAFKTISNMKAFLAIICSIFTKNPKFILPERVQQVYQEIHTDFNLGFLSFQRGEHSFITHDLKIQLSTAIECSINLLQADLHLTKETLQPFIPFIFPDSISDPELHLPLILHIASHKLLSLISPLYFTSLKLAYEDTILLSSLFLYIPNDIFWDYIDNYKQIVLIKKNFTLSYAFLNKLFIMDKLKKYKDIPEIMNYVNPATLNVNLLDHLQYHSFVFSPHLISNKIQFNESPTFWILTLPQPQLYLSDQSIESFFSSISKSFNALKEISIKYEHPETYSNATKKWIDQNISDNDVVFTAIDYNQEKARNSQDCFCIFQSYICDAQACHQRVRNLCFEAIEIKTKEIYGFLHNAIKPTFIHSIFSDVHFWYKILVEWKFPQPYTSAARCFIANFPPDEIIDQCISLLSIHNPPPKEICVFLLVALPTEELRKELCTSPKIVTILNSINQQPPFQFWRLFNRSSRILECLASHKYHDPILFYGLVVSTTYTNHTPKLSHIYIDELTDEAFSDLCCYVQKTYPMKQDLFQDFNYTKETLSLLGAAHHFANRAFLKQSQPKYHGINQKSIILFFLIACQTYEVLSNCNPANIILTFFKNNIAYEKIVNALKEENFFKDFSYYNLHLQFYNVILKSMDILQYYNSFCIRMRPIILRFWRMNLFDQNNFPKSIVDSINEFYNNKNTVKHTPLFLTLREKVEKVARKDYINLSEEDIKQLINDTTDKLLQTPIYKSDFDPNFDEEHEESFEELQDAAFNSYHTDQKFCKIIKSKLKSQYELNQKNKKTSCVLDTNYLKQEQNHILLIQFLFIMKFSHGTTTPAAFIKRKLFQENGFISHNLILEPTKETVNSIKRQEKDFFVDLGPDFIEKISSFSFPQNTTEYLQFSILPSFFPAEKRPISFPLDVSIFSSKPLYISQERTLHEKIGSVINYVTEKGCDGIWGSFFDDQIEEEDNEEDENEEEDIEEEEEDIEEEEEDIEEEEEDIEEEEENEEEKENEEDNNEKGDKIDENDQKENSENEDDFSEFEEDIEDEEFSNQITISYSDFLSNLCINSPTQQTINFLTKYTAGLPDYEIINCDIFLPLLEKTFNIGISEPSYQENALLIIKFLTIHHFQAYLIPYFENSKSIPSFILTEIAYVFKPSNFEPISKYVYDPSFLISIMENISFDSSSAKRVHYLMNSLINDDNTLINVFISALDRLPNRFYTSFSIISRNFAHYTKNYPKLFAQAIHILYTTSSSSPSLTNSNDEEKYPDAFTNSLELILYRRVKPLPIPKPSPFAQEFAKQLIKRTIEGSNNPDSLYQWLSILINTHPFLFSNFSKLEYFVIFDKQFLFIKKAYLEGKDTDNPQTFQRFLSLFQAFFNLLLIPECLDIFFLWLKFKLQLLEPIEYIIIYVIILVFSQSKSISPIISALLYRIPFLSINSLVEASERSYFSRIYDKETTQNEKIKSKENLKFQNTLRALFTEKWTKVGNICQEIRKNLPEIDLISSFSLASTNYPFSLAFPMTSLRSFIPNCDFMLNEFQITSYEDRKLAHKLYIDRLHCYPNRFIDNHPLYESLIEYFNSENQQMYNKTQLSLIFENQLGDPIFYSNLPNNLVSTILRYKIMSMHVYLSLSSRCWLSLFPSWISEIISGPIDFLLLPEHYLAAHQVAKFIMTNDGNSHFPNFFHITSKSIQELYQPREVNNNISNDNNSWNDNQILNEKGLEEEEEDFFEEEELVQNGIYNFNPYNNAQMPNNYVQMPNNYVQIPNNYVQMPNTFVQMPNTFVQIPNNFVQMPNTFVQVPNNYVQVPNNYVQVPNNFVQMPNNFVQMPNSYVQMSNNFVQMPNNYVQIPNNCNEGPNDELEESNDEIEESNDELEESNDEIEESNDEIEESNDEIEESNNEIEESNNEIEESNNEIEESNNNIHESNNNNQEFLINTNEQENTSELDQRSVFTDFIPPFINNSHVQIDLNYLSNTFYFLLEKPKLVTTQLLQLMSNLLEKKESDVSPFFKNGFTKCSSQLFIGLCSLMCNLMATIPNFPDIFEEKISPSFYSCILSPAFRNDEDALIAAAKFITLLPYDPSPRAIHLLMFMLLLDHKYVTKAAIQLYLQIPVKQRSNASILFLQAFRRNIHYSFENPPISILLAFLEADPRICLNLPKTLLKLLSTQILVYSSTNQKDLDNQNSYVHNSKSNKENELQKLIKQLLPSKNEKKIEKLQSFLLKLFSLLCPSPQRWGKNYGVSSIENPIPKQVYDLYPEFWDIVIHNQPIIAELADSIDFKLLPKKLYFTTVFRALLSFKLKYKFFQKTLFSPFIPMRHLVEIRRSHLLEDSFTKLESFDFKTPICIKFKDEIGVDTGGLTKEWLRLLTNEICQPNYGLFRGTSNGRGLLPSANSFINPEHLRYFRFAGKIFGKVILEKATIDVHLSVVLYKKLLSIGVRLKDMEDIDEQLYHSLTWILENDVDDLGMTFVGVTDRMGKKVETELIKEGSSIEVKESNKKDYVKLTVQYQLEQVIKDQTKAFINGFQSVIDYETIAMFKPNELDLIICGIPRIDVNDMKAHTAYKQPLHKNHPLIIRFFNVMKKWKKEELGKLLLFVTGSSQVPVGGFKGFEDMGKPFTIEPGGDRERLPVAHTCINTLDLPEYESEQELNDKLLFSISECNTFEVC